MISNKKPKAIFITNYRYVSSKTKNGGMKLCTLDFIKVIEKKYDLVIVEIDFTKSILKKLKFKLGIDVYDYYDVQNYYSELQKLLGNDGISKVFINTAPAMKFSEICKKIDPDCNVVLLSHGNESGDFIHELVNKPDTNLTQSYYKLGKQLVLEAKYRKKYIDKVVVVSDIEKSLEYWLHSKEVLFLPRFFDADFLKWNPISGKIGFLADFTHLPNLYGVKNFCEELSKRNIPDNLKLVLVGVGDSRIDSLSKEYPFIQRLGYLSESELKTELGSWMAYLNIVLYYSKGVSTKLAKGMDLGLPVITTTQGNRGYTLSGLEEVTANNVEEFVDIVLNLCNNKDKVMEIRKIVIDNVNNQLSLEKYSRDL